MKALKTLIEECRSGKAEYQALIDRVPYARFLGIQVVAQGDELTFVLPKHDNVIGNPTLPALHGGSEIGRASCRERV